MLFQSAPLFLCSSPQTDFGTVFGLGGGGDQIPIVRHMKTFRRSSLQICVVCVYARELEVARQHLFSRFLSPTSPNHSGGLPLQPNLFGIIGDLSWFFLIPEPAWHLILPQCELEDEPWVCQAAWSFWSKFHTWTAVGLCELEDEPWVRRIAWSSLSKFHIWTAVDLCEFEDDS